ncbi:hypothetical protein M758_UG316000 [Ceratodon purpureus]|nr:hypothetical protein M758_UG316000 [Ceratodon purpureus]
MCFCLETALLLLTRAAVARTHPPAYFVRILHLHGTARMWFSGLVRLGRHLASITYTSNAVIAR